MPLPSVFGPVGSPGTDQPDPELLAEAQRIIALSSLPTTIAVLLAAIGFGMLYTRRRFDRLSRTAAVSAIVMAIASALAAVAVLALLAIGPARAIGVIDLQVGVVVAVATAAASASAVELIRAYVDPMVAHVWAGIAGAGIALPFMVAGISPALVVAGAVGIGVLDRARGARTERELARRNELEAEQAARAAALPEGAAGRGVGVRGLPGLPPVPRAPRPMLPWSSGNRRASVWLGVGAVLVVALAWAVGAAAAEAGLLGAGQGFALASLGAVPLLRATHAVIGVRAAPAWAMLVAYLVLLIRPAALTADIVSAPIAVLANLPGLSATIAPYVLLATTAIAAGFAAYAVLPLAQSASSTGRRVAVAAAVGLLVGLALYSFAPYIAPLAALGVAVALLIGRGRLVEDGAGGSAQRGLELAGQLVAVEVVLDDDDVGAGRADGLDELGAGQDHLRIGGHPRHRADVGRDDGGGETEPLQRPLGVDLQDSARADAGAADRDDLHAGVPAPSRARTASRLVASARAGMTVGSLNAFASSATAARWLSAAAPASPMTTRTGSLCA